MNDADRRREAKSEVELALDLLPFTRLTFSFDYRARAARLQRMSPPKCRSSWSFSLKNVEYSDSSQEKEELPQPQLLPRRSEADQLIAEAEQEAAAEDPEPELFDISLVDEGDVRFVETPFTIARRAAITRKRARKEDEEVQDKVSRSLAL